MYSLPQEPGVIAELAGSVTNLRAEGSLPAPDTTPPVLAERGFLHPPTVTGPGAVTMSARPATDDSRQVEYRFARSDEQEHSSTVRRAAGRTAAGSPTTSGRRHHSRTGPTGISSRCGIRPATKRPSPALNRSPSPPRTGYHLVSGRKVSGLPDDTLVTFSGTVSEVKSDAYLVTADGARITVTPTTKGCATDTTLKGRTVTVRGCVRSIGGSKRVTWAELK